MRVIVVLCAIIGVVITLAFGNPILGLAFTIIPFILYMVRHCSDVTDNQEKIIELLKH